MSAEAKIKELNLELPPVGKPLGAYQPIVISGNMAYLSGHGPIQPDGSFAKGRVGENMTKEQGYDAARRTALAIMATLRDKLGSLDKVERIVKVVGMVNSTPDFYEQPAVINGCSELLREVFGEDHGVAARSAFGVAALPAGWVVEIEAIVGIKA
ncbi:MAG: RidA family protein [Planctomycetota bacterium]